MYWEIYEPEVAEIERVFSGSVQYTVNSPTNSSVVKAPDLIIPSGCIAYLKHSTDVLFKPPNVIHAVINDSV